MKYKYSCADFTFPLLPHDKVIQLIGLLGLDAVDLGVFEDRSHHYPSMIAKHPQQEAKRLSAMLNETGLEAADVFLQTGAEPSVAATNSPDLAIRGNNRELFKKILDFTNMLGCCHITGLPGVFHGGIRREEDWNIACEETNWRVEMAHSNGIVYSIEPHLGSIVQDATTTLQFLKECPGLTLTLDYGHFIYQGQSNESVHPLIAHASHFHARGGAKQQLQTLVKENEIDFKTILEKFKETGYAGYICMEYVYNDWGGCNRTDNISETILNSNLIDQLSGL